MADSRLLMQILNQMDPGRLGQLISQARVPEQAMGRGLFDTKQPGLIGGTINLRGPFQQYGSGVPEVRR